MVRVFFLATSFPRAGAEDLIERVQLRRRHCEIEWDDNPISMMVLDPTYAPDIRERGIPKSTDCKGGVSKGGVSVWLYP